MNAAKSTVNIIKDKIAKRSERLKHMKASTKRDLSVLQVMKVFFDDTETIRDYAINEQQFYDVIKRKADWLHSRITEIDSHADTIINYNDNSDDVDWKILQIMSITVRWSEAYREAHPGADEFETFDPMVIAMSEMLEE